MMYITTVITNTFFSFISWLFPLERKTDFCVYIYHFDFHLKCVCKFCHFVTSICFRRFGGN
jgi:hypothetical protein